MRIRLAAFIVVAVLTVSACSPSGTDDPAGPDTATTTSGTAQGVRLELVATHDESTIPGLEVPGYMASDGQGQLYVANSGNSEILVLDSDGRVKHRFGERGTKPGQFDFLRDPTDPDSPLGGIAVAVDGSVYVVESGAKRVQHLTAKGRPLASWGTQGRNDGQGNLVNADFGNGRVQAWDSKGQLLWTLGSKGTGPGQFTEPQDVAFGPDGRLLVVDDARVQVFNAQRELRRSLAG